MYISYGIPGKLLADHIAILRKRLRRDRASQTWVNVIWYLINKCKMTRWKRQMKQEKGFKQNTKRRYGGLKENLPYWWNEFTQLVLCETGFDWGNLIIPSLFVKDGLKWQLEDCSSTAYPKRYSLKLTSNWENFIISTCTK